MSSYFRWSTSSRWRGALDGIIDAVGRAAIEAVLDICAAEVAGESQPGRRRDGDGTAYHGRQRGRVYLADRAVRVGKPRLRGPGGEVAVPAYEALRRPSGLGERTLELLLAGLGTRSYGKAVGEMAETAGVSKVLGEPEGGSVREGAGPASPSPWRACRTAAGIAAGTSRSRRARSWLAHLAGDSTPGQVAKACELHPNSVGLWKRRFVGRAPEIFVEQTTVNEYERRIRDLEQLMGKREVEIALLRNILSRSG